MFNQYMNRAIELAEKALAMGEIPVGAVVVRKSDGVIIGEGYNRRECDKNPVAHAEIEAILRASEAIGSRRLKGCALYVTLEPCPMCAGAIINSMLDAVYFGTFDKKGGAICSVEKMFSLPYNHKPEYYAGIMEDLCSDPLNRFFNAVRMGKE